MRKSSNRILSCVLCLICALALFPTWAFAAGPVDTEKSVTLAIDYRHDGSPVSDAHFDLYRVANIDAYAAFTPTDDFVNAKVDLGDRSEEAWRALAETLSAYVAGNGLASLDSGETNAAGALTFPNQASRLMPGLYLVVGQKLVQNGYTYTTEPFLICLPNLNPETDAWEYAVTAQPKHTRTENPPSPQDETTSRKVTKVWEGDVSQDRPEAIAIRLLKDGAVYDAVTLSEENDWSYSWENLPKYDENDSLIAWSVMEDVPDGYTVRVEEDGAIFFVTNSHSPNESPDKTKRTVVKIWDDAGYETRRPESVTVTLLRNGERYDAQVLSEANGWQHTWNDLPKYDGNDEEIDWTIREDAVPGYASSVRQNALTFTLTNSIDEPKLPQTGVLWWPVPVLAAAGLTFLGIGRLRKAKAKADHE